MKILLPIFILFTLTMCADDKNYSTMHGTYKKHVSKVTEPVLSYSRSVSASDIK